MVIELKTQDNLEYTYNPVPSKTLRFKVKAGNDAHIILSAVPSPSEAEPVVEVFIGGWGNSKSAIRVNRTKPDKDTQDTPKILSGDEFRGFWVSFDNNVVAAGREGDDGNPFVKYTSPEPLNINYYGLSTGYGSHGEWIIEDTATPPAPIGFEGGPPVASGPVTWIPASGGTIPPGAVMGGYDNENIYVGRAHHEGALIPGKVLSSHGVCYVPWGGGEHGKPDYEILTGSGVHWVQSVDGQLPPGAVPGGNSEDGETLYIGRATHEGTQTVGKVQPSHKVCYIPFGGQELSYPEYEVLVSS